MSASMPRTASTAPDMRQVLVAVVGLILAVALLVAVTISRQATSVASTAPAVPASVAHDHGWSAAAGSQDLVVGGLRYTGIPYPTGHRGLVVGGLRYTGIPYPTGDRGLIVGGLRYTGIPYPAPESGRQVGGGNGTRFAQ